MRKLTNKEFLDKLNTINPNVIPLEKYSNRRTKIKCKCLIDSYEWYITPGDLMHGYGCPKCAGNIKYTLDSLKEKISKINKNIEICETENYKNVYTKIKVKCLKDNFIWETTPHILLTGHGCPHCKASKGEEKIAKILLENKITYEIQKTFETCRFSDTNHLAYFDFYLPDYNCLIEYDGQQHFSYTSGWNTKENLKKTRQRDKFKNQWCKDNNILLIRIPYVDFDKINYEYLKEKIDGKNYSSSRNF